MSTIFSFDGQEVDEAMLDRAIALLRAGDVVGLPTETVYGLAADGLNGAAVAKIFRVKGRPTGHPVILHIGTREELDTLCAAVPPAARRLAEEFWPGPLTIILRRSARVPAEVTGGLETVGIRMPAHPVALALLRRLGRPLAAPSANRFGRISPTTRRHVLDDLGADVPLVLEGGPCQVGVESTIIDVSRSELRILRHGSVTAEDVRTRTGLILRADDGFGPAAPGTLASHYAPRARVRLVPVGDFWSIASSLALGQRVGVLCQLAPPAGLPPGVLIRRVPQRAGDFARELYEGLRQLDESGCEVIVSHLPELSGVGIAVADRLQRAAAQRDENDYSDEGPVCDPCSDE